MTVLITASAGSFPRIGEGAKEQKLRKAFSDLDSGKINREELSAIERQITAEAIVLQTRSHIELVTDGQISWHDPISHILAPISGVEIGSLIRFFDTNCYYRQPIIKNKLSWQEPVLLREFNYAKDISIRPVKPVITGPYTLACLSINYAYDSLIQLVEAIAKVIAYEVAALAAAGATLIQIDEPCLVQNPSHIARLQIIFEEIARYKGTAKLALYTYFGNAALIYEKLQQFPVDVLGVDFTYSRSLVDVISILGSSKTLGLGLIDGRNTSIETEEDIFPLLDKMISAASLKECYLNPSCGLEYLPKCKAVEKLGNMVKLRNKYSGVNNE